MRLIPDPAAEARLRERPAAAGKRGLDKVRDRAKGNAPRRSGEFAASLEVAWDGQAGGVFSGLPQAGAVERGANVGPRKGPHMEGSHVLRDAGRLWPQLVTAELRSGR